MKFLNLINIHFSHGADRSGPSISLSPPAFRWSFEEDDSQLCIPPFFSNCPIRNIPILFTSADWFYYPGTRSPCGLVIHFPEPFYDIISWLFHSFFDCCLGGNRICGCRTAGKIMCRVEKQSALSFPYDINGIQRHMGCWLHVVWVMIFRGESDVVIGCLSILLHIHPPSPPSLRAATRICKHIYNSMRVETVWESMRSWKSSSSANFRRQSLVGLTWWFMCGGQD